MWWFDILTENMKTQTVMFSFCSLVLCMMRLNWNARPRVVTRTHRFYCVTTVAVWNHFGLHYFNPQTGQALHLKPNGVFKSCLWLGDRLSEWQVITQWGRTKCFMSIQSDDCSSGCRCAVTSTSLQRAVIHRFRNNTTRVQNKLTPSAFRWKDPLNGLNHNNNPI